MIYKPIFQQKGFRLSITLNPVNDDRPMLLYNKNSKIVDELRLF